jgi:hypothetical protein
MIYLAIGLLVSAGLAYGIAVLFKKYEQLQLTILSQQELLVSQQTLIRQMLADLESIKYARGTFSRQLGELTGEIDKNIVSMRQDDASLNRRIEQLYRIVEHIQIGLAQKQPDKKAKKK